MKKVFCHGALISALFGVGIHCVGQTRGASVYVTKCGMCHGTDGIVVSPAGRSLGAQNASDPAMKRLSASQMFASVSNGKGRMPAYKTFLSDQEIRDAVAYFQNLGLVAREPVLGVQPAPVTLPQINPKAASKENFAKAITAYYGDYSFCLDNTLGEQLEDYYFLTPGTYQMNARMNDLFVRAGLLTLVSQHTEANPTGLASQMVRQFAITPLGRQYYKTGTGWSKTGRGFCYGTPVVQIVDFEDPGPNGTHATVTFKYRLSGVPTWLTGDLAQEFRNTKALYINNCFILAI